jgi:hypothetical protein
MLGFKRKSEWKRLLKLSAEILLENNPIDSKLEHQLMIDVDRSFVQFKYTNVNVLARYRSNLMFVLRNVFSKCPWLHYYQGFHDICSVLLLVLNRKEAAQAAIVIANIWLYDFMQPTFKESSEYMSLLKLILEKNDRQVYEYFQKIGDFEPLFCVSWVMTWLSHNLQSRQTVLHIYDCVMSTDPTFPLFIVFSIIHAKRDSVLITPPEMDEVHSFFLTLQLDELDWQMILSRSFQTWEASKTSLSHLKLVKRHRLFTKGHFVKLIHRPEVTLAIDWNIIIAFGISLVASSLLSVAN